jgi:thiol-disulfide isomerase/thioredoxin
MQPQKDENGMIPLPKHEELENLFRPRRPTEDGFLGEYAPYVVVNFSAKWCGPCQKLNKKALVEATPDIKWYSVDVDINKVSLGYCGLQKIPSFCIIKDGVFKDRVEGLTGLAEILLWLQKNDVPIDI